MPRLREISPADVNTEPRELELQDPTYALEEGTRGTAEAETITDPKRKQVGSIYDEIPEYEGTYVAYENGTYPTAGLEMRTDFVVDVQPKGLTTATLTENGTYKPEGYDGYSQVEVDVFSPTLTTLEATENTTYEAPAGTAYSKVIVNVAPPIVIDPVLANNSWEVIKQVCQDGDAGNYWALGDSKTIAVSGVGDVPHAIVDMTANRYEYANDNTKHTNVVFQAVPTIGDYQFNPSSNKSPNGDTAYNGWDYSNLRTSMNSGTIYGLYDSDFKSLLEQVKTMAAYSGKTDTLVYSADKLFIPAAREVKANYTDVQSCELGITQYGYYALNSDANSQRIKYPFGSSSATDWWLRSPRSNDTYNVRHVIDNGAVTYDSSLGSYGIAPCFAW